VRPNWCSPLVRISSLRTQSSIQQEAGASIAFHLSSRCFTFQQHTFVNTIITMVNTTTETIPQPQKDISMESPLDMSPDSNEKTIPFLRYVKENIRQKWHVPSDSRWGRLPLVPAMLKDTQYCCIIPMSWHYCYKRRATRPFLPLFHDSSVFPLCREKREITWAACNHHFYP
jgi:hypothetical protein